MEEILKFYNKLHFGYCDNIDDFLGHNPEIIDIDHVTIDGFGLLSKIPNTYWIKFIYKGVVVIGHNRSVHLCGMNFFYDKENTPTVFEKTVCEWLAEHNKSHKELTIEDLKILQFYLEVIS